MRKSKENNHQKLEKNSNEAYYPCNRTGWKEEGKGVSAGPGTGRTITHVRWADHTVILGKNWNEAQTRSQ